MNQRYLLDTNAVSYIVKGRSLAARSKLATLKSTEVACISAITEAEVRYGLAKNRSAEKPTQAVEAFFAKIGILAWGSDEARVYGALRAKQEAAGRTLGNLDLLIAAQAIAVGAILVSNDRAFSQVKELRGLVNWATDL